MTDDALQALKRYPGPGKVRELVGHQDHSLHRVLNELITLKDLPRDVAQGAGRDSQDRFRILVAGFHLEQEVATCERHWVEAALNQARGVKSQAAKLLGINKDKMKHLCRKHEL